MNDTSWLSVDDVAKHLGVRRETVYRWISRRGLPGHKTGKLWLFRASEVDAWVQGRWPSARAAVAGEPEPQAGVPAFVRDEVMPFIRPPSAEDLGIRGCVGPREVMPEEPAPAPAAVGTVHCPIPAADGMVVVTIDVIAVRGNGGIVPIGAAASSYSNSLAAASACLREHHESMGLATKWLRQVDLGVIVEDAQPGPDDGSAAAALVVGAASVLAGAPARTGLAVAGGVDDRGVLTPVASVADMARAVRDAGYREFLVPAADAGAARSAAPGLLVTPVSSCPQLVRQALSMSRAKYSMVEKLAGAAQGRLQLGE